MFWLLKINIWSGVGLCAVDQFLSSQTDDDFPFLNIVLALADKINIDILHTLETHPSLGFQNIKYKYLDIVLEGRYLNIKIGLKLSAPSRGQVIVCGAVSSPQHPTHYSHYHTPAAVTCPYCRRPARWSPH